MCRRARHRHDGLHNGRGTGVCGGHHLPLQLGALDNVDSGRRNVRGQQDGRCRTLCGRDTEGHVGGDVDGDLGAVGVESIPKAVGIEDGLGEGSVGGVGWDANHVDVERFVGIKIVVDGDCNVDVGVCSARCVVGGCRIRNREPTC